MAVKAPIPLPYLLGQLHRARFTGRLRLTQADVERAVLLQDGSPVHVQSRLQEETLGRILLDEGRLSQQQYNQMLDEMMQTQRPAGEVLIGMGALGPQDVFSALEFQARKKLINSFRMDRFDFELAAEPVPPELMIGSIDVFEIILSGLLACYSVDRMLEEFSVDEETVFMGHTQSAERPLRLGAKETRILRTLGRGTSLAKLMASGTDLRYLLAVLYSLCACRLADASGVERPRRPELDRLEADSQPPAAAPTAEPEPVEQIEGEEDFRPPTLAAVMRGRIDESLAQKVLAMGRQDHFSLLGVDRRADKAAIESAYQRLLRQHKLGAIDESYKSDKERELARRLLDRVATAYRVLTDDDSRRDYLQQLTSRRPKPTVSARIKADVEAQKAMLAMRHKRWQEAQELLRRAIALYPEDPSYHFQLGKLAYTEAQETTPPEQPLSEALRKSFLKALAINPRYDEPRLYLGYLAKRNGNFKQALREFQGAIECNPHNQLALSEERLLRRRLRKTD